MTTSQVRVPVSSDDVVEGSEKFNLILFVQPSLDPAITAGNISAVGIIIDSTSKCTLYASRNS